MGFIFVDGIIVFLEKELFFCLGELIVIEEIFSFLYLFWMVV